MYIVKLDGALEVHIYYLWETTPLNMREEEKPVSVLGHLMAIILVASWV